MSDTFVRDAMIWFTLCKRLNISSIMFAIYNTGEYVT